MSESVPPTPAPQATEVPNPLEIFYEQHKTKLWGLVVILFLAFGANYALKKYDSMQRDAKYSAFLEQANLDAALTDPIDLNLDSMGQMQPQMRSYFIGAAIGQAERALLGKAEEHLKDADPAQIETAILEARKNKEPIEPWLMWIAAQKARFEERWDDAEKLAKDLQSRHSEHILCIETDYPVQVREETAESKEKREESTSRSEEPEYEPAEKGSIVSRLLTAIAKDRKFRDAHKELFTAPEPDTSETVVLKIREGLEENSSAEVREVEIAFYPGIAPKHVAAFKQAVSEKHFDGMVVHEVVRAGKPSPFNPAVRQAKTVHLGVEATKTETDRTKWVYKDEDRKDEDMLEWEPEGPKKSPLSFFPGMLAGEQEKNGEKSSAKRILFCVTDGAIDLDGEHVIFGKVIRGLEVLQEIADSSFSDATSDDAGRGRLSRDFKVVTATLNKK